MRDGPLISAAVTCSTASAGDAPARTRRPTATPASTTSDDEIAAPPATNL